MLLKNGKPKIISSVIGPTANVISFWKFLTLSSQENDSTPSTISRDVKESTKLH
jgi:hypothetical protein